MAVYRSFAMFPVVRHMRVMLALTLSLLAVALNGCAPAARYQASVFDSMLNEPYLLATGDRVRVLVFGQEALSNSYSVDASGQLSMPLIGLVPAYGVTTEQLGRNIEARLRNGFLREPRVAVEVEVYRPFFVLGEVTSAGQYPFVNGITIQNAIAIAGGYTPRGSQWSADLTRVVGGRPVTATVPITHPVRPGDTIVVRERFL